MRIIRNQARWECRKAKKEFERSLEKEAKSNPKAVFSYANRRTKTRSGIADLQTEEGTAVTDLEKSEALNDFFSSVFTIERPTPKLDRRDIKVQCSAQVFKRAGCHLKRAHLAR